MPTPSKSTSKAKSPRPPRPFPAEREGKVKPKLDLGTLFCPFQKKWITDPAPLKIVEKGRQEGFTWIEAFWSVLRRLEKKINHYFVSADEETAKNFIADCKFWLEQFDKIGEMLGEEGATAEGTVGTLIFPNGSRIVALSSNPKSIRGKRGDVTLDEFAFHEKAKKLYQAAIACKRWGDGNESGHLHIISTHDGPQTLFYKLCQAAKKRLNGYSYHHVDLVEAVRDGLAEKVPGPHRDIPSGPARNKAFIDACRRECDSEETFLQEYMCEPAALSAMVRGDVYDNCATEIVAEFPKPQPVYPHGLYVGIDCGRSKDLTVAWVLERYYDKFGVTWYRTVGVKAIFNQIFPEQHDILQPTWEHDQVHRGLIDQGSQGRALADSIVALRGKSFEAIGMGSDNKAKMAERLRAFAQSERITFPLNREDIRDSIMSVRKCVSEKGNLTYEGGTEGDHADYFWAAALALHAAENDRKSARMTIERRATPETVEGELVA
jgi:phage FluMu gp28-like protein